MRFVITVLGVNLVFRMFNLPVHEVSLNCVFFSCTCEICTTRNSLFMKLINLVIFTQDQKGDPLNVLSSICTAGSASKLQESANVVVQWSNDNDMRLN